jgi:hypothetical protein
VNIFLFSSKTLEIRNIGDGRHTNGFILFARTIVSLATDGTLIHSIFIIAAFATMVVGAVILFLRSRKDFIFVLFWLILTTLFTAYFFEAQVVSGGISRFYLKFLPIFAVLVSSSVAIRLKWVRWPMSLFVISIFLIGFHESLPYIYGGDIDKIAMFHAIEDVSRHVPDECLLVVAHPWLYYASPEQKEGLDFNSSSYGCIYFFKDSYCHYYKSEDRPMCEKILQEGSAVVVESYPARSNPYVLFRIK